MSRFPCSSLLFLNDAAATEIYTLSLHDALPILRSRRPAGPGLAAMTWMIMRAASRFCERPGAARNAAAPARSEEHTSELQSRLHLVCRLLLEKKNYCNISPIKAPMTDISCSVRG